MYYLCFVFYCKNEPDCKVFLFELIAPKYPSMTEIVLNSTEIYHQNDQDFTKIFSTKVVCTECIHFLFLHLLDWAFPLH